MPADHRLPPDVDFIVVGATGWLGLATIDFLFQNLGSEAQDRVAAFASRDGTGILHNGTHFPVFSLNRLNEHKRKRPSMVFHYAFQTKDKVANQAIESYQQLNRSIQQSVRSFLINNPIYGFAMPSSGAVYQYLASPQAETDGVIYGRGKYEDEQHFAEVACQQNFPAVIPRLFNLSGPYINKHDLYALSSIILNCLRHQDITLKAFHPVWRSYYGVMDLIKLILAIINQQKKAETALFDTVGAEVIEVGELAQICRFLLGNTTQQILRPHVLAEPNNYYVGNPNEIRHLESIHDIQPMPLDNQIITTADYLRGFA